MGDEKRSFMDHAADGIGNAIEGAFWLIGRASPAIEDTAKALASTKVGEHFVHHAHRGWAKGYNSCLNAREKRERRKAQAQLFRTGKAMMKEVVDIVHEGVRGATGHGPQLRPVPD